MKLSTLALIGFSAALALSSGCSSAAPTRSLDAEALSGREWTLISLEGEALVANNPKLLFDANGAGSLAGFSGVNRYFGDYSIDGDAIRLRAAGMTKMAGPPELMALEARFVAWLDGRALRWDLAEGRLMLYSEGRAVMELQAP